MAGLKLLVLALSLTALFAAYDHLCEPDWKMVSAGNTFTLALDKNGYLYSFGENDKGQLGLGSFVGEKSTPQRVMYGTTFKFILARYTHAFAITTSGSLYAWGWNTKNVLGLGSSYSGDYIWTPSLVDSSNNWRVIATGKEHTLGLTVDGYIYSWGDNDHSQLGAFRGDYSTPKLIDNTRWNNISAGEYSSYAISSGGFLYGWGDNTKGQLGNTSYVSYSTAVRIGSGQFKSVAAGRYHVLAIDYNDTLHAWGQNYNGELGAGYSSSSDQTTPKQVSYSFWKTIAAGDRFSLAINSDGKLYAWGINTKGQLGTGSTYERYYPAEIGSKTWSVITAGENHAAGITTDGKIRTWGYNWNSQLGGGTFSSTPRTTPGVCDNDPSSSVVLIIIIVVAIIACVVGGFVLVARKNQNQMNGEGVVVGTTTQLTPLSAHLTHDVSGAAPQFIMHQSQMNQRY